jgi:hypothetical protein
MSCFVAKQLIIFALFSVLWIRIGFNADPDPAFYFDADPDSDPDPGSQTNADPDQTFE